jgi:hypothetical protein
MKLPIRTALTLACILTALAPAAAQAAPITVNLRVEGSTTTLFEGPIVTDAHQITAPGVRPSGPAAPRECNNKDNGGNGGFGTVSGGPTTAVFDAMAQTGQAFESEWDGNLNDLLVTRLGDDGAPGFWSFAVNYSESPVGGCQYVMATGSEVLWAYNGFGQPYLKLSGPSAVTVGDRVTFKVINAQTGAPLSGATVAGVPTDNDGNALVTFTSPGVQRLKAERPSSVRSNRLDVNVVAKGQPLTPAAAPGTPTAPAALVAAPDRTRPLAKIASPRNKVTYRAKYAPRRLSARVAEDGSGVKSVRMRLTRKVGKKCWQFDVKRERFVGIKCGKGTFAEITRTASFEYLLPERLKRGHYVFDVTASDRSANADTFRSAGRNRVVFDVK